MVASWLLSVGILLALEICKKILRLPSRGDAYGLYCVQAIVRSTMSAHVIVVLLRTI